MYEFLRAIVSFIFVLGVLVFIHELGHYLAARWRGVHVDVFSIGFGKPLYRWHDKVGTEWRICPIPLGGYVKPHGFADPEDVTEEERATYIPGKTFHGKDVGSRAIVIAAGPIFNFLLAIILFIGLFSIVGTPHLDVQPIVKGIVKDSPASKAGLEINDTIIKIDNLSQPSAKNIVEFIAQHPDLTTNIVVKRDNKDVSLPITIGTQIQNDKSIGRIGLEFKSSVNFKEPLSIIKAVPAAFSATWNITYQTVVGIGQMVTGQRSAKELGGPIKIAQMSGQVSHGGFADLISFMALLSINLGLINLFPIPILDGGRLVFYAIEAVIRKPVPKKIQAWGFQIGFALILLLFVFSTYNDVSQLSVIRWLTGHSN
ncbi:RIP metalloprotease RseP [Commensalibacter oyaizuii]|uniref:Zinc metalloprotease n=1 Tax=Commensalibacter oyaizuii TaxID=3043873 RepID=A0ABT6Q017_9PROT|nr:RIP metalloprotease RseP [Commensalibacter sp. TBRC 16381]MDI2090071.1 RIP metalloprotease RseP [Commensalibacter sp. TBRC 16381]